MIIWIQKVWQGLRDTPGQKGWRGLVRQCSSNNFCTWGSFQKQTVGGIWKCPGLCILVGWVDLVWLKARYLFSLCPRCENSDVTMTVVRATRAGCSPDSQPGLELASFMLRYLVPVSVSVSTFYLLIRHESNKFRDHLKTQLTTIAFIFFPSHFNNLWNWELGLQHVNLRVQLNSWHQCACWEKKYSNSK